MSGQAAHNKFTGPKLTTFCVRCKKKKELESLASPKVVQAKNGRFMVQGGCPTCGGNTSRFVSEEVAGSGLFKSIGKIFKKKGPKGLDIASLLEL